ncbi:phosphatidylglycerophosphatase A [Vibrio variabilis]|nr:phosphatidylglycerophosphatase A [Vibrio variabilis]
MPTPSFINRTVRVLAYGLGAGKLTAMPGTIGTLLASHSTTP